MGKINKRVVVTGMGLVSPLASTSEISWERLISGLSGIKKLPADSCGSCTIRIGGIVPSHHDDHAGGLDINKYIPLREQKKSDRFIH